MANGTIEPKFTKSSNPDPTDWDTITNWWAVIAVIVMTVLYAIK